MPVLGDWHARRLPDRGCLNSDGLRCHNGGFGNSKLQGSFVQYEMIFDLDSGPLAEPATTGRISLSLHSHDPQREPLLVRMLNGTAQRCTDLKYCTVQTWWKKYSPKVHVTRDVARLMYPLTPVGKPFPYYDMTYNESISMDQLYGSSWWNATVQSGYAGYTSVADLQDCDVPIDVVPSLQLTQDAVDEVQEVCAALQSPNPLSYSTSYELPFLATALLPLTCARVPLPDGLYNDLISDVGAHDLRTAYDLQEQEETGGGLPGTLEFLRPAQQLTGLWSKYEAVWQYLAQAQRLHRARFFPPCTTGPNPDTAILSHYYKHGPVCQLYQVAVEPQWLFRTNITLTFNADEVKPAMAQPVPGTGGTEYQVQMSWWLLWDGKTVTVQPEGDYSQAPIASSLRHFMKVGEARIIQLDDSKHHNVGPRQSGYIVLCGAQLDSALGVATNPWTQPPWFSKPSDGWYQPVPAPGFLRTGWTDDQWNNQTQADELAPFRPGMWYTVPTDAALTQFGSQCGQVGATGPCPTQSSSLENTYGPIYAFGQLDAFSQNVTQYNGYPNTSLQWQPPYLPPLARGWTDQRRPQAWVAAHTSSNIPLSLLVEPTIQMLEDTRAEFRLHISERLSNPRQHPLHRRSAGNSTTELPLRNVYKQTLNTTLSQCIIQWYNLSHAYAQNDGNLTQFISTLKPPSADQLIGAIHAHFCDPPGYRVSPSLRQPSQYAETWVCEAPPNATGTLAAPPPLIFRAGSPADSLFNASLWDSPTPCRQSRARLMYSHQQNQAAATAWWRAIAQYVQNTGAVRFEIARCRVQLTDPVAEPNVALFPANSTDGLAARLDPRIPVRFLPNATELALVANTVSCFIQIVVDEAAFIAGLDPKTVAEARELLEFRHAPLWHCMPFTDGDCGFGNAYMIMMIVLFVWAAVATLALLGMFIYCMVECCQKSKRRPPPSTGGAPNNNKQKTL